MLKISLLTCALVALLSASAAAGTLVMTNHNANAQYCAAFDLWSGSGATRGQLCTPPNTTRMHDAALLSAYGKIAVYKTDANGNHEASPEERFNPEGLLLPSRSFVVEIGTSGSVRIFEKD